MTARKKISMERADRVRLALIGTFFTQAMVTVAIVVRIPEIIKNLGLSNNLAIWGTITGFAGLGSMLALVFAHRLVQRIGTTRVIRIGTLASTAIQGVLPLIHNYWLYFIATFVQAMFFSFYNNGANGQALMIQHRMKKIILGPIHGAWSLGVAVSSLLAGVLSNFLPLTVQMGLVAGIGFVVHLVLNTQLLNHDEEKMSRVTEKSAARTSWLKTPRFVWLIAVGMFVGIWPELVMGDWMSVYSTKVLNLTPALIAIPFTAFATAMIIGRFATGWVSKRIHVNRAASYGGYLGGIAMTLGIVSGLVLLPINELLAVVVEALFFFIAGLGESIMVPAFYSAANHIREIPSSQALARLNMVTSIVMIGAKGLMGTLADTVGLAYAMIFPIVTFFVSGYIQNIVGKKARKREAENVTAYPPTGTVPIITIDD